MKTTTTDLTTVRVTIVLTKASMIIMMRIIEAIGNVNVKLQYIQDEDNQTEGNGSGGNK